MIFVYCTVIHYYYLTFPHEVAGNEGANGAYTYEKNSLLNLLLNAAVLRLQVVAEERSLDSYLELYTRCLEAENTTLMRNPTASRFR
jgi:hypothetical protein